MLLGFYLGSGSTKSVVCRSHVYPNDTLQESLRIPILIAFKKKRTSHEDIKMTPPQIDTFHSTQVLLTTSI